ncbi:MAG: hypothetical protein PG981_000069 [Wolbachia endosymbiont of Ctenocephalides orientis wCori]|nr:MAG: hypothetical protein PG981_000069 [Wolbachia endosymbiont of Ctenocephalides orientis wCori]
MTYQGNEGEHPIFVKKDQTLEETVTEVIAGSLYNALLYDRSPVFRLVEAPKTKRGIALKSKLLDNFITLGEYIHKRKQEKLLDLIYEKFSDEDGRKEITGYMADKIRYVPFFKNSIKLWKESIEGSEEFFNKILEQLNDKDDSTELKEFSEFKNILVQIFKKFKDKKETIKKLFIHELSNGIKGIEIKIFKLSRYHNQWSDESYRCPGYVNGVKEEIEEIASCYQSLNEIVTRLDKEEFNKEFLAEIIEEIKKTERMQKQLISYSNQDLEGVTGIEKIITSMMLLGYYDFHSGNIGIMDVKGKDEDGNEITKKVYAKVDMSASFGNLKYTNYLDYIEEFEYMLNPQQCIAKYSVDYLKLKKEINEACDLFTENPDIKNPDYVESLIHRALFYTKPLLKKKEELGLVKELAKEVIKQAGLLKKFANSEEFMHLEEYIASGYKRDYFAWAVDTNKKIHGKDPIIYVMENKLFDSLTWALKDKKQIEDNEPFN